MTERIVSAYAAAPHDLAKDPTGEIEWYQALRDNPLVDGLELSYTSGLHPEGGKRLAALLDPAWSLVVTNIRRTLGAGYRNPAYGLASADDAGRRAAVDDVATLRRHIAQLERPVLAVELHSAPNRGRAESSAAHLERSLDEILSWGWGETRIVLEHCDAFRSSDRVQKGFLSLVEELETIAALSERLNADVTIALNWGRSVIEAEGVFGADQHLDLALRAKLLGAFFFSGAAAVDSSYGAAWRDIHLPLNADEPTSLLTSARIQSCVERLPRSLGYVGIKSTSHPSRKGVERLAETFGLLNEVDRYAQAAGLVRPERA